MAQDNKNQAPKVSEQLLTKDSKYESNYDKKRFELVKSALAGIAMHRPDRPSSIAMSAIALADSALSELGITKD